MAPEVRNIPFTVHSSNDTKSTLTVARRAQQRSRNHVQPRWSPSSQPSCWPPRNLRLNAKIVKLAVDIYGSFDSDLAFLHPEAVLQQIGEKMDLMDNHRSTGPRLPRRQDGEHLLHQCSPLRFARPPSTCSAPGRSSRSYKSLSNTPLAAWGSSSRPITLFAQECRTNSALPRYEVAQLCEQLTDPFLSLPHHPGLSQEAV